MERGFDMPALFLVLLVRMIIQFANAARNHKGNKPPPLCTDCAHAHVQYAVNGRRAIACTFAGGVRPVQIDVIYCTDFRDRKAAPRIVQIGFAPIGTLDRAGEIANVES